MQKNELKAFIKQNSPWIYEYVNSELLKDIGTLNPEFYVELTNDFFNKEEKKVSTKNMTADILAYYMLTELVGDCRHAYTFFRKETLTFNRTI